MRWMVAWQAWIAKSGKISGTLMKKHIPVDASGMMRRAAKASTCIYMVGIYR
jgi:hypothetical protein